MKQYMFYLLVNQDDVTLTTKVLNLLTSARVNFSYDEINERLVNDLLATVKRNNKDAIEYKKEKKPDTTPKPVYRRRPKRPGAKHPTSNEMTVILVREWLVRQGGTGSLDELYRFTASKGLDRTSINKALKQLDGRGVITPGDTHDQLRLGDLEQSGETKRARYKVVIFISEALSKNRDGVIRHDMIKQGCAVIDCTNSVFQNAIKALKLLGAIENGDNTGNTNRSIRLVG